MASLRAYRVDSDDPVLPRYMHTYRHAISPTNVFNLGRSVKMRKSKAVVAAILAMMLIIPLSTS
ncbi:MAG: hypothetical protein FWH57_08235, partial [Oscillospiraceae bacterium]|nr:hypothetical protein [Oscillospiraceae bacterium]